MPGPPLSLSEADTLCMSLLASGAYISLSLCDPIVALDYATQLLECPTITPQLNFLGRMYKAEALILNGCIQEASELLSPETIQDSWFSELQSEPENPTQQQQQQQQQQQPQPQEQEQQPQQQTQGETTKETQNAAHIITCKNDFPDSGNQARVISYLNLCSVFCMGGELEKARKCLTNVSALGLEDTPPQAVLLSVYIELQTGNVSNALQLIKRHQYVLASRLDKKKAKKL